MALQLNPPARFRGTAQEQLQQCYSYLFRLHQQLNTAITALERVSPTAAATSANRSRSSATPTTGEVQSLKSLIIQNATLVRREMEKLETELRGSYVAISDFGTYLEEISARIEADPTALTQYYSFISSIQANLEQVDSSFRDYLVRTEGYIRTGIVSYDGAVPVYGVAVGQDLVVQEVDGERVVEQKNFRATFTASKLSFWQDAVEVAYVSNNRLYISNITVLQGITLGRWEISDRSGLAFQWIGG